MRVVPFYSNRVLVNSELSKDKNRINMIKYDYTDNEIVLCREFINEAKARIALAALENNGIESIIDNVVFSRIYPIGTSRLGALRLMVRRRDLERALDVVNTLNLDEY